MILSRVADALYWMGRYLERAENVTRLLIVTEEMSSEVLGLDEDVARAEWSELRAIFPDGDGGEAPSSLRALVQGALYALSIDPSHPHSIFFSLKKARDNARTVREALTIEVFVALNETYKELEAYNRRQMADPTTFRSALTATQRGILSTACAVISWLRRLLMKPASSIFSRLEENGEPARQSFQVLSNPSGYTTRNPCLSASSSNS